MHNYLVVKLIKFNETLFELEAFPYLEGSFIELNLHRIVVLASFHMRKMVNTV